VKNSFVVSIKRELKLMSLERKTGSTKSTEPRWLVYSKCVILNVSCVVIWQLQYCTSFSPQQSNSQVWSSTYIKTEIPCFIVGFLLNPAIFLLTSSRPQFQLTNQVCCNCSAISTQLHSIAYSNTHLFSCNLLSKPTHFLVSTGKNSQLRGGPGAGSGLLPGLTRP